jgi:sodium transport system permease protein
MVIYQGCMAIAPESIAGEKERGTLGTLLVTPAKRHDMALAKVISVTVFGVLGAAVSFAGLMLSLPALMSDMDDSGIIEYTAMEYLQIFVIVLSTVLVFVALLSVLSTYSKTIKEANSYAAPLMMISMALGMSNMFTGGAMSEYYYYLIPIFNSAQALMAVFSAEVSTLNIAVTTLANTALALICVGVIAQMFNSEKIVFDK